MCRRSSVRGLNGSGLNEGQKVSFDVENDRQGRSSAVNLPAGLSRMAKEEALKVEGVIAEILPDGRFRDRLENDHEIIAYTAGKMRKNRIRSIVGDRVHVEMTPYDLDKGRIVFREKTVNPPMNQRRFFRRMTG